MVDWADEVRAIVRESRIWYVATTNADGSPHVSPMWADLDGDLVLFNTTVGRVKERNLRRDPRVCLSSVDQADPFDRVQIHGRAVRFVTGEQANRQMDALAGKYLGADRYEWLIPGEQRVTVFVEPTRIRRIVGVEPLPAAALGPDNSRAEA